MRTLNIDGKKVYVDSEDADLIKGFDWYAYSPGSGSGPYFMYASRGHMTLFMHRLIAGAPPNRDVYHVNGDTFDNRKNNLRYRDGARVFGQTGSSQYRGVTFEKQTGRWRTTFYIPETKTVKSVGRFDTEIDAALAYDEAAKAIWGEYARLNFEGSDAL